MKYVGRRGCVPSSGGKAETCTLKYLYYLFCNLFVELALRCLLFKQDNCYKVTTLIIFFHVSIVRATAGKTKRIDTPVFSTKSLQT
jgi:hypothetical protein